MNRRLPFPFPFPRGSGRKQLPVWAIILILVIWAWQSYQSRQTSSPHQSTARRGTTQPRTDGSPLPPGASRSSSTGPVTLRVLRAVDGDTLLLENQERVRLLGVDTPETKRPNTPIQPWGPEAAEFTKQHVEGKVVRLEFDQEKQDKYNRTLAYVYVGDWFLNEELIRAGLSPAVTKFPFSREMKQRFLAAEAEARRRRIGIWSGRPGVPVRDDSNAAPDP